jgi:hypothetical protein
MKEHREEARRDDTDYVWRFPVQPEKDSPVYDDPIVEMVRSFLADLLHLGHLTRDGKRVDVDGFQFANDSKTVYQIFPKIEGGEKAGCGE